MLATQATASPIEPCRPTVVCTVEVQDLPAVLLASGGYDLLISGQAEIPLPSSGQADIAIFEPVTVRLSGATYHGAVTIDPADCSGDEPHVLAAAPKPAKLEFRPGAVPISDLVVSCVSGCPYQHRPADNFPLLPFSRDDTELLVALEFKARGHRSKTIEYNLSPGDNLLRVSLQAVEG